MSSTNVTIFGKRPLFLFFFWGQHRSPAVLSNSSNPEETRFRLQLKGYDYYGKEDDHYDHQGR